MESTPRSSKDSDRFYIDNTFFRGGWASKLGPYAIAVYNTIAMHADSRTQEAWPSHATIAKLTGMSARQVIREVERLESYNIVSIQSRVEERKPAIITLLDKSAWKPIDDEHMTGSHMQGEGEQVTDSHKTDRHMTDSHKTYDSESDEHMTPSHTNKTHKTKPNNKIPNGSGKKPQEDPKKWDNVNKKIVGDKFLELTHVPFPTNPKTKGAWYGWLYELFEMSNKDPTETCRIMSLIVEDMHKKHLTISSPKSLHWGARALKSGQELNGAQNGTSGKYDSPPPGNRQQPTEGKGGMAEKVTAALRAISRTGSDST